MADVIDRERVVGMQLSCRPHLGFVKIDGRTAAESPTGTSGGKPCLGPLLNQPTLELRECGKDVEDQLARRAGCVDETVVNDARIVQRSAVEKCGARG